MSFGKKKLLLIMKYVVDEYPSSVADSDPGSGAFLTPRSGIRNRVFPDTACRISDPGSQTHTFQSFVTILWVKKFFEFFENLVKFFVLINSKIK
jgi:hypothetical protein